MTTQPTLADLGLALPDLLLPTASTDLTRWAVIACDQFTSDGAYWRRVADRVADAPSTLNLVLPEYYLGKPEASGSDERIRAMMRRYLADGTLVSHRETGVYLERTVSDGEVRRGIVLALDLAAYDWRPGSTTLVRASEATIASRLPARAAIRRGAPIETPHVLVLFDDPDGTVADAAAASAGAVLYDVALMEGGGRAVGRALDGRAGTAIAAALQALTTRSEMGFLFATGDGNHSLAAARQVWDEAKDAGAADDDPRRWALVEFVNVHDRGLAFHPIHRVARVDPARLAQELERSGAALHETLDAPTARSRAEAGVGADEILIVSAAATGGEAAKLYRVPAGGLPVAIADDALAAADADTASMDWVHELDEAWEAAGALGGVAVILPEFPRGALLPTVARDGALPRKAFSLGRARDKRYYLECRRILKG